MIETVAARLRKLEGVAGAPVDEVLKFRLFGVSALADGTYERVNLKSGNRKVMTGEQLGIEPYEVKQGAAPSLAARGATLDTVAVPEQAPAHEAPAEHEETPEERIERIRGQIARDFGVW